MGFFSKYPYTNFSDLNLDYMLNAIADMQKELTEFVDLNIIKYADPLQWDITRQYEKNTVVVDTNGNAYLSSRAVPLGVAITNESYWRIIGNFDELVADVKAGITFADEGASHIASAPRAVGDIVWVDGDLVEVTSSMVAGDQYRVSVESGNCQLISVEHLLHRLQTNISNEVIARTEAVAAEALARSNAITAETTARTDEDNRLRALIKRRFIFLGDSYADPPSGGVHAQSWMMRTIEYAGLSGDDVYYVPFDEEHKQSGSAFGNGYFLNHLTNWITPNVSHPETITDIIVCGGYNDIAAAAGTRAGITAFGNYVKQTYPNARVHIGMIGNTGDLAKNVTIHHDVLANYRDASVLSDVCDYIAGSEHLFHIYYQMTDRGTEVHGIHPDQYANAIIARGIANWIRSGTVAMPNPTNDDLASGMAGLDGLTVASGSARWIESDIGDSVRLEFAVTLTHPAGYALFGYKDVCTYLVARILGSNIGTCDFGLTGVATLADGSKKVMPIRMRLTDGIVKMSSIDNSTYFTQLEISTHQLIIPKLDC